LKISWLSCIFGIKVDEGLKQLDEGRGISHEEVEKRMAKWLKE